MLSAHIILGGSFQGVSNFPLFLSALIFSIHFSFVYHLGPPLMWNLPDSELAVLTRCEEHVFQFVIVDEAHFVCECCLKHQGAFTAFFDISDSHQALLSAFTIATHAR